MNTNLFKAIVSIAVVLAAFSLSAQSNTCPVIGAQVFIEPGQTAEEIDGFFSVMEECGLKSGRIRMFGSHMMKPDGSWDFSLYDTAFECAAKHGVKLFATLFPPTDELNDVGGFKFPDSPAHLAEVEEYTRGVVGHFKDKEALECWVLQNEPGLGGVIRPDATPLSKEIYKAYRAQATEIKGNGYLAHPLEDERFTRYYTNWYLGHIAGIVKELDPAHGRHINPHQILRNLPEYEFTAMEEYLTSLGSSMHASWHFGDFGRNEYPLGVAIMSDIIATSAGKNPWWITEMQGGPVTASGDRILCPDGLETRQAVWTGIFSGTSGIMFWTLNPRKAVREAGEWALLDFAGGRTERLDGISDLTSVIDEEKAFFDGAEPVKSNVYILFSKEAFWVQNNNVKSGKSNAVSRSNGALPASIIAAYKSLSASGLSPVIQDIATFDFNPSRTVILPDVVALSDKDVDRLCRFVEDGGNMISTGWTWYYDQTMGCRFMSDSPLYACLGGRLKEFKIGNEAWGLEFNGLDLVCEHWSGTVIPGDADEVIKDVDGRPMALVNRYGKGVSLWFPSMIDIGSRSSRSDIGEFYRMACGEAVDSFGWKFDNIHEDVYSRILKNGSTYMMLIVNNSDETHKIKVDGIHGDPVHVDGEGKISRSRITVPAGGYLVFKWNQ